MRPSRHIFVLATVMVVAGCTSGSGGGDDPGSEGNISTFSKSYGGPLHDEASVVLNTSDGGFMLFGTADSNLEVSPGESADGGDWWLQKLDVDGNVERTRLFGGSTLPNEIKWSRTRPLRDGGAILTGTKFLRHSVPRPDGNPGSVITGRDIAVARLDASGTALWTVSYDSGAWEHYDFFATGGDIAEAADIPMDVWPAEDGGYFVSGTSTANLDDRQGSGFPCEDADIAALSGRPCVDRPPNAGTRFLNAFSIVVLRLNEDGSLRWMRRLTDNAFNLYGNFVPSTSREPDLDRFVPMAKASSGVALRPTADGGVVLARTIEGGILVHRLAANGAPRWRATASGIESPAAIVESERGFAIAGDDHVIQLNTDGSLRWQSNLAPEPPGRVVLDAATQTCESGRCNTVVVGNLDTDGSGFLSPARGRAWLLDGDGAVNAVADPTPSVGEPVLALTSITPGADNGYELLGVGENYQLARMQMHLALPIAANPPAFTNYRVGTEPAGSGNNGNWRQRELRADGGVLELTEGATALRYFDAHGLFQLQVTFGGGTGAEGLGAAAQIADGQYVLAGTQREDGIPQVVVMRYDFGRDAVVWQHKIAPPANIHGHISTAIAATGTPDGGVVLSLVVDQPRSEPGWLLKLDANGNAQWQVELPFPAHELHPTSEGTITALTSGGINRVTRVSAAGEIIWEKHVAIEGSTVSFNTMTPSTSGGVVLAGNQGTNLSLLRLADDGTAGSAREVQLGNLAPSASLFNSRIRETANGDFIVAMTEHGLITTAPAGANRPLPYGQNNIFVLKVDVAGHALWGRVYGGADTESVYALSMRNDGAIAVAGFSDSLGDGSEAWLLKLSADGLVDASGCQALLGSLPVSSLASSVERSGVVDAVANAMRSQNLAILGEANLPMHTPQDFVTARQCQGIAGGGATSDGEMRSLTVQREGMAGVVSSEPLGISCGTGLDICTAEFARGSRITLRAEPDRFVGWLSPCDAGSGGTQLFCIVTLNDDLTVLADFRPPAPAGHFSLSFEIQGPGSVFAGDINCQENTQPLNCSHEFTDGASVAIRAFPELDWLGSGYDALFLGWSGDDECASLGAELTGFVTVDHEVHCIAQFRGPNIHLLRIFGSVGGEVTDDSPTVPGGGEGRLHCREVFTGCQTRYPSTTTVPLLATPDFGYRFVGWGGDCASFGSASAINVLVADNTTCTATFERATTPQTLTVHVSNSGPQRVVESDPPGINCFDEIDGDCSESYAPGTEVRLSSDYYGVDWIGCDRVDQPAENAPFDCIVRMDQQPRVVSANFHLPQ